MKTFLPVAATLAIALSSCCNKNCNTADAVPDNGVSQNNNEVVRLNVFYTLNDVATADAMKAIADSLVTASRTDQGCITYDMFESTTTPGQYIIIETWQNDSLLTIHSRAPHFEKYVPRLQELGSMSTQRFTIPE